MLGFETREKVAIRSFSWVSQPTPKKTLSNQNIFSSTKNFNFNISVDKSTRLDVKENANLLDYNLLIQLYGSTGETGIGISLESVCNSTPRNVLRLASGNKTLMANERKTYRSSFFYLNIHKMSFLGGSFQSVMISKRHKLALTDEESTKSQLEFISGYKKATQKPLENLTK